MWDDAPVDVSTEGNFIQSAVNKMDNALGQAAIIENGSPLFSGGTSSGEN